jgi:hypothetical protein
MAYKTNEIADNGPDPGTPTVAEMRDSQRKGSAGIGTADQSNKDSQADFGLSPGPDNRKATPAGLPWLGITHQD